MSLLKKFFSGFLIALLLFPISVEFAHIFAGHKHHFCNHYSDSHFHQHNQDCSLFHFQHNAYSSPEFLTYRLISPVFQQEKDRQEYHFLSTQRSQHFFRRGPPQNVLPC